jgi:cbb3-type cytochrome oxidase maturation protein
MNVLYFMVPLALALGALMVSAFWWAARRGQFDDLDTPAVRILIEDDEA